MVFAPKIKIELKGSPIMTNILELEGTWEGDDFEECLQLVYDSQK